MPQTNTAHRVKLGVRDQSFVDSPAASEWADEVRSWLTSLVAVEHLSLLVGSGLSIAVSAAADVDALDMSRVTFTAPGAKAVDEHAQRTAVAAGRGSANIEDQLRSALQLLGGLEVADSEGSKATSWRSEINRTLAEFASAGLAAEAELLKAIESDTSDGRAAAQLLVAALLAFSSRPGPRERLAVFTTNYDRLIELGCDMAGIRILDRFVGSVEPVFRASRLDVDMHYNPPGIRGEPRYLDGVLRLSKLHGSFDWRLRRGSLQRIPLAFGATDTTLHDDPLSRLMIYPNAAKDVETLLFPYAELFRDFAASICRPNGALITYGYGFGDDHLNRVLRDMLTIRSTHLLVIAFGDADGRIARFLDGVPAEQHSLLLGPHFGDLATLVSHYLPQPSLEPLLARSAGRARELANGFPASASQDSAPIQPRAPS